MMHKEHGAGGVTRATWYGFAGCGTSAGCSVEESEVVLKWKMFTKFDLAFKKLAVFADLQRLYEGYGQEYN